MTKDTQDVYRTPQAVIDYVLEHTESNVIEPAPGSGAYLLHVYALLICKFDKVLGNPPYSVR